MNVDSRIQVTVGDITRLEVDAIVNAANESLLGGGGVDGAIHRAAGARLLKHNRTLGGCPTGQARRTPAFDLEEERGVRHLIHAVGPIWRADAEAPIGQTSEDILLASAYRSSLELAAAERVGSLAFPAISTGVYRFPKERAARIAIGQVRDFLSKKPNPERVLFCCFYEGDAEIYRHLLQNATE